MKPGGAGTIEGEAAQQNHARNGILRMSQTRAGQVVMDETL
jgi:hypothetical protein